MIVTKTRRKIIRREGGAGLKGWKGVMSGVKKEKKQEKGVK